MTERLVLADGCFDGLHIGHIAHLCEAARHGNKLIVALASDKYVEAQKGSNRPWYTAVQREAALRSLRCVDGVVVTDEPLALVRQLKPALYAKGAEYRTQADNPKSALFKVIEVLRSYGGELLLTDTMLGSSSGLLNSVDGRYPSETDAFLKEFRLKHTEGEILGWLESLNRLDREVTIIGEDIQDIYVPVKPMGRSAKEHYVTWVRDGGELIFSGGARIISEHQLALGINSQLITNSPAITKSRFVDMPFIMKLGSVVHSPTMLPIREMAEQLNSLVVVADFGHGLFDGEATRIVTGRSNFLALMVQSNSFNWGFNLLRKWPRADYFVIDEPELRLNCSDNVTALPSLLAQAREAMKARIAAVTQGHKGCLIKTENDLVHVPVLSTKVVDRMGAGDCFLAVTAPLAYLKCPPDILGFLGSAAAALHVAEIGNPPLNNKRLVKFIRGLMA